MLIFINNTIEINIKKNINNKRKLQVKLYNIINKLHMNIKDKEDKLNSNHKKMAIIILINNILTHRIKMII